MNQTDSFASPAKYFIFIDNISDIESVIGNFTIYPSSDILIAEKYGSDYKLHGVYRINAISDLSKYILCRQMLDRKSNV